MNSWEAKDSFWDAFYSDCFCPCDIEWKAYCMGGEL